MNFLNEDQAVEFQKEVVTKIEQWQAKLGSYEVCPMELLAYKYNYYHRLKNTDVFLQTYSFLGKAAKLNYSELIDKKIKFIDELESKLTEAQQAEKKLLVVMGEAHNTQHSYLLELMIGTILKSYGFGNLMIERKSADVTSVFLGIYPYVASKVLGYSLIPIDSKFPTELREEVINKNIAASPAENTLCQVGANHLDHIMSSKEIQQKFVIFPINIVMPINHLTTISGVSSILDTLHVSGDIYSMQMLNSVEGFSFKEIVNIYKEALPDLLSKDDVYLSVDKLYEANIVKMEQTCVSYSSYQQEVKSYLAGVNDEF